MTAAKKIETETLPVWDMRDFFSAVDGDDVRRALKNALGRARKFADTYKGNVKSLSAQRLCGAIQEYEQIEMQLSRLGSYAHMQHSISTSDAEIGRAVQAIQEGLNEISTELIFFTLEINEIEDKALREAFASDKGLANYAPWLRDTRIYRKHLLPEEQERIIHEMDIAGRSAWVRLYDRTLADSRFMVKGEELTEAEVRNLAEHPDRNVREEAARAVEKTLSDKLSLLSHIHNTLAKEQEIENRWRNYPTSDHARHLANLIEPEVVAALMTAVKGAYGRLSHRYFKMKAKWLNLPRLESWDVRAPLPAVEPSSFTWAEAQQMVQDAYDGFDPRIGAIIKQFFDKNWIDAKPRAGKYSGAYMMPTSPDWHPYIMMNFLGKAGDVSTLAHELGHGVHQTLSDTQGYLHCSTPLTLAETASVFGEMLTFRSLLAKETDLARKKSMIADKVEDSIGTMIRQIAYYDFELQLHAARQEGELTPDEIDALWVKTQSEAFGDAVNFGDVSRHNWAWIPHFIHSPFYVYAYAFGECLVNALYMTYQQQPEGFADKYYALLSAGGRLRHKELLAPFGLDATDPNFWQRGLQLVEGLIDELEALDKVS